MCSVEPTQCRAAHRTDSGLAPLDRSRSAANPTASIVSVCAGFPSVSAKSRVHNGLTSTTARTRCLRTRPSLTPPADRHDRGHRPSCFRDANLQGERSRCHARSRRLLDADQASLVSLGRMPVRNEPLPTRPRSMSVLSVPEAG